MVPSQTVICITGWSNWILLRKLKYSMLGNIERALSNSIQSASISCAKFSWTTLYTGYQLWDRTVDHIDTTYIRYPLYNMADILLPFRTTFSCLLFWAPTPHSNILANCIRKFLIMEDNRLNRTAVGTVTLYWTVRTWELGGTALAVKMWNV